MRHKHSPFVLIYWRLAIETFRFLMIFYYLLFFIYMVVTAVRQVR
jgi:hypothetical protein